MLVRVLLNLFEFILFDEFMVSLDLKSRFVIIGVLDEFKSCVFVVVVIYDSDFIVKISNYFDLINKV